jgi:hypothetical protein
MEIVLIIVGIVPLAWLAVLTLRRRGARGSVQRGGGCEFCIG